MSQVAHRLVFLGAPGAGKGTQSIKIALKFNLAHISTGEIMRRAKERGDDLGNKLKDYIDQGLLVPDELVIALVRDRLSQEDCKNGFILDGFPRTLEQAKALDSVLMDLNAPLSCVIELEVPEALVIERIKGRALAGSGRADDTEEVAKKRFEVYRQHTVPVSAYYKTSGLLALLNGVGSVEQVTERIISLLN